MAAPAPETPHPRVAIIGAGPAGLTAGYLLSKQGIPVEVLEADPQLVGGISRTARYKDFHFDIGGHRFFSKSQAVEDLWSELLPDDMLERPRRSRIFYNGRFFSYPLKGFEAAAGLGPFEALRCLASYARAKVLPIASPQSFEDWVVNQFGRRLFEIFFKTYTEKVWGMDCKDISADWAAQRIQGLSLGKAIWSALVPARKTARGAVVKTLLETFRYPRRGPGMLWEACAKRLEGMGGKVRLGASVVGAAWDPSSRRWTVTSRGQDGRESSIVAEHLISSAPLHQLAAWLAPGLSAGAREAGARLRYRDFVTVMLILKDRKIFDDNWLYIHEPGVKVGRIQNFKSWSPEMVPDPELCCYGFEYFCFEGDGLWASSDAELMAQAGRELEQIGLGAASDVLDGCVVRQAKAYPIYDDGYAARVEELRLELEGKFPTLHLVGRNGMHKYNNQDHAMMTAMLTVENIVAGGRVHDVWRVNQDAEYHEAGTAGAESASGLRLTPLPIVSRAI